MILSERETIVFVLRQLRTKLTNIFLKEASLRSSIDKDAAKYIEGVKDGIDFCIAEIMNGREENEDK
jgi:hypothetical protein